MPTRPWLVCCCSNTTQVPPPIPLSLRSHSIQLKDVSKSPLHHIDGWHYYTMTYYTLHNHLQLLLHCNPKGSDSRMTWLCTSMYPLWFFFFFHVHIIARQSQCWCKAYADDWDLQRKQISRKPHLVYVVTLTIWKFNSCTYLFHISSCPTMTKRKYPTPIFESSTGKCWEGSATRSEEVSF